MSKEAIVERIVSDAEAEAREILRAAEEKAAAIAAEASAQAEKMRAETKAEVTERAGRIRAGREASARLDGAKILLAEKRRVIDSVYEQARDELASLSEKEFLKLTERLLKEYAEEGDEIVFSKLYGYTDAVSKFPVVKERKLKISDERADVRGGFWLRGKTSDKDLSFASMLRADREIYQSEIAQELFKSEQK